MISRGISSDKLPRSGFVISEQKTPSILYQNINTMQDIRRLCFKVNLIRQMQSAQFMHQSQFHAPEIERLNFKDIDEMSKLSNHDTQTPTIAEAALTKAVGVVVMSTGFESANPYCTMVLSQLAEQYFGNLVKSLTLHMESNSINKIPIKSCRPTKFKDILQMTLSENGIEKPDTLYSYYKEHLTKQNRKLCDLKAGLEGLLRDLLRPGIQDITEKQFTDDSEQFLNGDFSEEIGEDFFGFKELGLDREFGLLTSSIPLHLLHSRLANQFSQGDPKAQKIRFEDFEEFKFPKLRKKDLGNQIGILKHYYSELLVKSKAHYHKHLRKHQQMVAAGEKEIDNNGCPINFEVIKKDEDLIIIEDDDIPLKQRNNRPKVPPNG
ncbi:unnamed protein product [Ambrosiozyma monospora]|uniref:Unnamed protein product n=1 Tax=Ambrosiozyma monospora TaxID=43982 RepID=A0A9W6SVK4_AMBMO|nr:unnamed protein product [Ambrosiozyma monospora]